MAEQQLEDIGQIELLLKLKNGDESVFTHFYKMYSGQMYVNILKMVKDEQIAEELVQELFTKIWHKRELIHTVVDFKAYLYKTGQNLVYDFFRKLQRNQKMQERFRKVVTEYYSHIEESLHLKQSEELLEKALNKLSVQQRKVYQLCKIDGYTYKEAAEEMGISVHTVKEYLTKASFLVKEYLMGHLDISLSILLFLLLK
ncbi:RNA polymerase sigma factor [Pedobacter gandavensis]|uniref:Sigma-70 family RNA polymerase sigma factor n=1 Tax=Pedobacter gandavensis TaxID=2679963 RepID=A0ABR6EWT0_9SPHI|nr:sigma-70 family RNA polymerase sigma factor [Pedobacter gandavensis]MBB2149738.1 sigma-70 family RNA polymerase sigma factor [Pedobacter gandavensis]